MPKRKAVKKVGEGTALLDPDVSGFKEMCAATKDLIAGLDSYTKRDIGSALQQVEFALQNLEKAKAKLMKV